MQKDINLKADRIDQAAQREQLRSPQVIQQTKAVRHSGGSIGWYEVIQCLTYPDPTKDPSDPLYLGYDKYQLRKVGGTNEIEVEYAIGFEDLQRPLRECFPWYTVGEIVPITSRVVDGVKRFYIWQTIQWAGDEDDSSIRWNADNERTMAVYK